MTHPASVPIRMIALVGDGVFSSVLDSQVATPLRILGQAAPTLQRALLVLTSHRHRRHPNILARQDAIRASLPGAQTLFRFRGPLVLPCQSPFWAAKLRAALHTCGYLDDAPIIVHCRGTSPAAAAAWLRRRDRRIRILLDMRGDPLDEVAHTGFLTRLLQWDSRRTLRSACDHADALNSVTRRLVDRLRQQGYLTRTLPESIIGCCVDTDRFGYDPAVRAAQRQELGLADKFVLCYCGSMAFFQRPDVVADAFAAVHREMPDTHLLIVSGEGQALVSELRLRGVPEPAITLRSATHDRVSAYLMAADLGLLLREDIPTNQVASPVKFGEYLRCGLPVILTHCVGDYPALVARENVGQAVRFPIDLAEIVAAVRAIRAEYARVGEEYHRRCSQVAADQLSWTGQIGGLLRVYEALARS